jgi:glycosyltransferase involved in cell wall biosynthesis
VEKLRILYFHQHFSTPAGKTGTRSYEMAKTALKKGHEVLMVCGSFDASFTGLEGEFDRGLRRGFVDGIEVMEFHMPYSNSQSFFDRTLIFLKFSFSATMVALKEKYDLVFCTSTPLTIALPGIFSKWIRGKPFVFEVRDLWPELPKAMKVITNPLVLGLMSALEFVAYRSADACIALAPGIAEGIQKRLSKKGGIHLVPNGCDLNLFDSSIVEGWRPNELQGKEFIAIFTGAHGVANGLDSVLDAALELKRRNRVDITLTFVGQGKLKPVLMERARKEGLANCIFLDPVPKEKLARLMVEVDLGLMILANFPAFYRGTSPNKFFDYIASGLPVLNNYPGWLADLISENDCGFVVEPDNPIAFADELERAVDNKASLESKGDNASVLARRAFKRDLLANDWVDVVESTYMASQKSL